MPCDLHRKIIERMSSRAHVSNEDSIEILMGSLIADGGLLPEDEIRHPARPVFAHRPILHEEVRLQGRTGERVVGEILDTVLFSAAEI